MEMKVAWKKHGFALMTALLLTLFSSYVLLDAFVIPRKYEDGSGSGLEKAVEGNGGSGLEKVAGSSGEMTEKDDMDEQEEYAAESKALPENMGVSVKQGLAKYVSETMEMELAQYQVKNTAVYAAKIVFTGENGIKTALANDIYGKNIKDATSVIAKEHNAILAVNGDFYGARNKGYVIREGVLYREQGSGGEDLVIYKDGAFEIINEREVTAQELLEKGAWNVLSFGPALVMDGEIAVTREEEVGKAMASNPRTAIGICEDGSYLMVVSDGRTSESEGLDLYELAEVLEELGAITAYNLDGGGSSTMVFQGNVVNKPTTGGRRVSERSVSDIVYVGE